MQELSLFYLNGLSPWLSLPNQSVSSRHEIAQLRIFHSMSIYELHFYLSQKLESLHLFLLVSPQQHLLCRFEVRAFEHLILHQADRELERMAWPETTLPKSMLITAPLEDLNQSKAADLMLKPDIFQEENDQRCGVERNRRVSRNLHHLLACDSLDRL